MGCLLYRSVLCDKTGQEEKQDAPAESGDSKDDENAKSQDDGEDASKIEKTEPESGGLSDEVVNEDDDLEFL